MSDRIEAESLKVIGSEWWEPGAILRFTLDAGSGQFSGHVATRHNPTYCNGYFEISVRSANVLPIGPGNYNLGFQLEKDRTLLVLPLTEAVKGTIEALADPKEAAQLVLDFLKSTARPSALTTAKGTPEECKALIEAIVDIADTWLQIDCCDSPVWSWDEWPDAANFVLEAILRWYRPQQTHAQLAGGHILARKAMQLTFEPSDDLSAHERLEAFTLIEGFLERTKNEQPQDMFAKARDAFRRLK